jgi:prevent-host-death family protein
MTEIRYSNLRKRLGSVLDDVCNDADVVIVRRRSGKDVAIISVDELARVEETARAVDILGRTRRTRGLGRRTRQV